MKIIINHSSMIPIYEQIVNQIKNQIISHELNENDALPSVRGLANELKISALTVKKAYDNLEQTGFIQTVHGKGSYVKEINCSLMKEEQLTKTQKELEQVFSSALQNGISKEELCDLVALILEEER
ncbi:GntR family transcriptional regulator [Floccifex sp.]|uniref:GntR family transcriptional regulator n=1 Tax=Floccifex sp. TaxID=2815810 RepID=UPI002A750998|nr:GntR family transcriptional regulator [Floccifex sp.]MDD7281339.1 GntR family transcriptional regulator [Erysipelotrichaceae bacterium]MDY2958924.1 GntR family transcriptional regulator [Floccifex sp.]